MGEYNFTATTDVRSQNYSSVRAHVERVTDEHSNEQIDVSKSHLNRAETLLDYEFLKREHYGDYVEKVNKNRRGAKGTVNSKYKNVDDYLTRTDGSCDTTGVQFFGNKELWSELKEELISSGMSEKDIAGAMDAGYAEYAEDFNRRNEYVKMVKWVSNHDESTPHWHGHLFTKGTSSNGKPLKSIDSALARQIPSIPDSGNKKMNKARMRAWREQEDTAFFDSVSNSLVSAAKSKGIDIKIDMYRKGEHNGLTMSQYKALKKQQELTESLAKNANAKVVDAISDSFPTYSLKGGKAFNTDSGRQALLKRPLRANLDIVPKLTVLSDQKNKKRSDVLDVQERTLREREASLIEKENKVAEREKRVSFKEKANDDERDILIRHKRSLNARETSLDARESDLNEKEQSLAERMQEIETKALEDAIARNRVQGLHDDLINRTDIVNKAKYRVDFLKNRMTDIFMKMPLPESSKKDLIAYLNGAEKTVMTDSTLKTTRLSNQKIAELHDDLEF